MTNDGNFCLPRQTCWDVVDIVYTHTRQREDYYIYILSIKIICFSFRELTEILFVFLLKTSIENSLIDQEMRKKFSLNTFLLKIIYK